MDQTTLLSFVAAVLVFPAVALAEEPGSTSASGSIRLNTEAPAPAVPRTYHMHDGFYLRVNFGVGALRSNLDDDGGTFDPTGRGFALGIDGLVGGSPTPGVAIGGAVLSTTAFSSNFEQDDVDVGDLNVAMIIVGPFIDGFFNPKKGWHMGAAIGVAAAQTEGTAQTDGISSLRGVGGGAWVGHDFWVAEDWSVGVQYRFAAGVTSDEVSGLDLSIVNIANTVMVTGLYH